MSGRSDREAHRMASGAQTDPWGNFLGRSRHEYDSTPSDRWLSRSSERNVAPPTNPSLGIVTAEKRITGATGYPSAQTAESSRNTVEPQIKRPSQ